MAVSDDSDVMILDCETVTAFGTGRDIFTRALFDGKNAISPVKRFPVAQFESELAAVVPEWKSTFDLFLPLQKTAGILPENTPLFFTTSIGEIENLDSASEDTSISLLHKVMNALNTEHGCLISAACAGGNMAILRAAEAIHSGRFPYAIAAGCDSVTEFVYSGFSSLHAMSPAVPRPYSADRKGLVLGDGAGIVLLCSRRYAGRNGLHPVARLEGWGASCDAVHITAPSSDGSGLASAIRKALHERAPSGVGAVIGHGTGTLFNDAMEIAALKQVFPEPLPLASVKGAVGHTLAASGLIQCAAALSVLERGLLFPQTNLTIPAPGAEKMVFPSAQRIKEDRVLTMNAGFGGVNAVLLFAKEEPL